MVPEWAGKTSWTGHRQKALNCSPQEAQLTGVEADLNATQTQQADITDILFYFSQVCPIEIKSLSKEELAKRAATE